MKNDVYPGKMQLNGRLETERIRAYFTGPSRGSIQLSDGSKDFRCNKILELQPFTPACIAAGVEAGRPGALSYEAGPRTWHFKGSSLGDLRYGPHGHPGDGEFDVRPVRDFTVGVDYSREGLGIAFSGTTEIGYSVCYFEKSVEKVGLEPCEFDIDFFCKPGRPEILSGTRPELD